MVMRLYTGLESSLEHGRWKPEGVPTVYNFIDRASKRYELKIILTCKDSGKTYTSGWTNNKDRVFNLDGLSSQIYALAGVSYFAGNMPRKLAMILRDMRHLFKISMFVIREKPDLIYCDGANVTFAYCLTKLFPKTPIILRLLGICSFLRSLPHAKRLAHRIYKLAFTGKFAAAIGTQDGTGTEFFFEKVLRPSVPRHVLLNGTDKAVPSSNAEKTLPQGWLDAQTKHLTVLFVGRVEEDKGIRTFITAMIAAMSENANRLRVIIVGSGSLLAEMQTIILHSGFSDRFHFSGSVPHEYILGFHFVSDIYVSTNIDGNLTNANLEAISANACMIIPGAQHEKFIDVKTSEYLSDCVLYFRVGDSEDLKKKVLHLVNHPIEISRLTEKLHVRKKTFMRSWDERVHEELDIIDNLVS